MAKWRANSDANDLTFEQLEMALDVTSGHENNEHLNGVRNTHNGHRGCQRGHSRDTCWQSRTNRTVGHHHISGHHCTSFESHQQYLHSNHLNHSSHPTLNHLNHNHYNHIHCNRCNNHSIHCNQELISEEIDTQSHGLQQMTYTLDQTEFERIWRQLSSNKDRYHFLQSLNRSSGNLVFSEISFGSLGDIATALLEFDQTVDDFVFVIYILNSLSRAKRFLLTLQFLSLEERIECKKLFIKLWKSMNDIKQDLAENDITEVTINALMKTYEVDID
ncbi:uncharacterized protein LOC128965771 [Oppia nitens]|uniref:uncharacterized protein LOC128965771 n=1 Tax=Oppia nitens TaxID=1686743 RepID=UPI0023D9FB44|nr:uncharacterized protein LOC128965771 [Oppia nitens]